ncbi:MAG: tRNA uridine-5-carboxymethylaminomethyl(34) synthesis GTPase MnmE [Proteobacteria bacterium]|nr:tRNA uridine-5-carboxymethylaminomethyl(34) synthesis GTPase MnmE [Pseudomonadota bacterium]
MPATDTIAAIATPPGVGGIGIVRVSGPLALKIGESLTDSSLQKKRVQFRKFYDSEASPIDHGLCLYFQTPNSFTGEDVVEIQVHGGPVLLDMLLERVCELGARLARAGEFSERAFLNGKIDLTQAEAIADLIESGSRAAAKAAIRSLEGQFSTQIHQLRDEIVELRAYIEAALDFAEEEIDFLADATLGERLDSCLATLGGILAQAEHGRVLNEGLSVALAGLPNAGKSSLLNYLAGYDAAIVTEIPGTTRDVVREQISLKGIPLRINDTAGLRDSDHPVEKEGVRRAWEEIHKADTVLVLIDALVGITEEDRCIIERLKTSNYHLVYSKRDLLTSAPSNSNDALYISTKTGEGMEDLITLITGELSDYNQDNRTIMARRRHVDALIRARDSLAQALQIFHSSCAGELIAEELREAQQHLNEITGEFSTEDLLGEIFSKFCVGK